MYYGEYNYILNVIIFYQHSLMGGNFSNVIPQISAYVTIFGVTVISFA